MAITGFSNYAELQILDAVFNATAFSVTTVYVSLHTADPDEDGSGAECTGGSYARQTSSWAAAAAGSVATDAGISFTDMPACTVTHVGLWDAVSAGNFLGGGALSASKVVGAADTFTINSGNLTFALN